MPCPIYTEAFIKSVHSFGHNSTDRHTNVSHWIHTGLGWRHAYSRLPSLITWFMRPTWGPPGADMNLAIWDTIQYLWKCQYSNYPSPFIDFSVIDLHLQSNILMCMCVKHMSWCMSGSLKRGGGENVLGILGACATHDFMYLARGPWNDIIPHIDTAVKCMVWF